MPYPGPRAPQQSGFSLLEVLIAMLVLAGGAAGLGLLLLSSVQGTARAQEHSLATLQASELAQLIHANPATLGHFMYPESSANPCGDDQACLDSNWAGSHLQQWQSALRQSIAEAQGAVCQDSSPMDGDVGDLACDGKGAPLVKIVWQQPAANRQAAETHRVVLPLVRP